MTEEKQKELQGRVDKFKIDFEKAIQRSDENRVLELLRSLEDQIPGTNNTIDKEYANMCLNVDFLDKYYKTKESNDVKSIKVVKNKLFKSLMSAGEESRLKQRILSDVVKKAYIAKDNINFIKAEEQENGNVKISAIDYKSASITIKKSRLLFIMVKIESWMNNKVYALKMAASYGCRNLSQEESDLTDTINCYYRILRWMRSEYLYNALDSGMITNARRKHFGYGTENFRKDEYEKNIIDHVLAKAKTKSDYSISSICNLVFDYESDLRRKIEDKTKVVKVNETNPITGTISVRNKREAKVEGEDISGLMNEFRDLNRFNESIAAKLKQYVAKGQKRNEMKLEIVTGDRLLTLYNVTSYGNKSKSSGSLYGSCMRHSQSKECLMFYSKNSHFCSMVAVTSNEGKHLMARAIMWYDKETGNSYVDRIFSTNEEARLMICSYIDSTDKVYGISEGSQSIKRDKRKTDVLVLFEGSIKVKNLPYFDTMRKGLYFRNGKYYMMSNGELSGRSFTKNWIKDTLYETGLRVSETSKTPVSPEAQAKGKCELCGKILSNSVEVNGMKICEKHIKESQELGRFVKYNGVIYLIDKLTTTSYITAYSSMKKDIDARKESDLTKIDENDIYGSTRGLASAMGIANTYQYVNEYEVRHASSLKPSNGESRASAGTRRRHIYHDETIKLVNVDGYKLLVPVNMTESEEMSIRNSYISREIMDTARDSSWNGPRIENIGLKQDRIVDLIMYAKLYAEKNYGTNQQDVTDEIEKISEAIKGAKFHIYQSNAFTDSNNFITKNVGGNIQLEKSVYISQQTTIKTTGLSPSAKNVLNVISGITAPLDYIDLDLSKYEEKADKFISEIKKQLSNG